MSINSKVSTFKDTPEIWNEHAQLVYSKETQSTDWTSSIHNLPNHSQILFITANDKTQMVIFTFFDRNLPHLEQQRIEVSKEHYQAAMVVD